MIFEYFIEFVDVGFNCILVYCEVLVDFDIFFSIYLKLVSGFYFYLFELV